MGSMNEGRANFRARMAKYYPRFSEGEYQRRYAAVRQGMSAAGIDVLVVHGGPGLGYHNQVNAHYLSNYVDQVATYVVFPLTGDPVQFVSIYPWLPMGEIISVINDVRVGSVREVGDVLKGYRNIRRVGVVGSGGIAKSIPHDHYEVLRQQLPNADFVLAADLLELVRHIPSAEELTWFSRGAELSDMAFRALVDATRPGVADYELFAAIHHSYLKEGGTFYFSWLGSTSMADPVMPYPWSHPSGRRVQKGDVILMEVSAGYWGYAGQLQRVITLGEPSPLYQQLFALSRQVYEEVSRALVAGTKLEALNTAAARIEQAGFTIQCPVVHGWGQRLTPPFCGIPGLQQWHSDPQTVLDENQLIVVEPNPCTPDLRAGVMLGNLNIVTRSGGRSLQKTPLDLVVLD